MKFILFLVILGAGAWFLMTRAKQNAAVQQAASAPEKYVKNLQNDVSRAKAAEEAASKAIKQGSSDVQKAVEAQ
jgi:cytoskeletal protein RodZ